MGARAFWRISGQRAKGGRCTSREKLVESTDCRTVVGRPPGRIQLPSLWKGPHGVGTGLLLSPLLWARRVHRLDDGELEDA